MLKRSSSSGNPGNNSSYITWLLCCTCAESLSIPIVFGPLNCSMLLLRFILDIPHVSFSRKYFLSFFICLFHRWNLDQSLCGAFKYLYFNSTSTLFNRNIIFSHVPYFSLFYPTSLVNWYFEYDIVLFIKIVYAHIIQFGLHSSDTVWLY